jgi:hypothetical protein
MTGGRLAGGGAASKLPTRRSFCHPSRMPVRAVEIDWISTAYMSWR